MGLSEMSMRGTGRGGQSESTANPTLNSEINTVCLHSLEVITNRDSFRGEKVRKMPGLGLMLLLHVSWLLWGRSFSGSEAGPGSVQDVNAKHEKSKQQPIRWVTAESNGYLDEKKAATLAKSRD